MTITLQALSLVEKAQPVQVRFTLCLRDQRSMWMQDGCKLYTESYMASNGSRFMVTWIIFKNHLLEASLTQNQETMALQTLTTIGLLYFIMCEDPHEYKCIEIAFGWGPGHKWLHTALRIRDHIDDFGRCLGTAFGHFLWALTISWSRLLARGWSGPQLRAWRAWPIFKLKIVQAKCKFVILKERDVSSSSSWWV